MMMVVWIFYTSCFFKYQICSTHICIKQTLVKTCKHKFVSVSPILRYSSHVTSAHLHSQTMQRIIKCCSSFKYCSIEPKNKILFGWKLNVDVYVTFTWSSTMHMDFLKYFIDQPRCLEKVHFTQDIRKGKYETPCFSVPCIMKIN